MKSVKSKHRLRTKSRPWDLQILASQLGWKTVYAFTKSASYFINISFKNLHLWKYLMALAFMSFFHSSIFASALSIDLQLSTVALPIFVSSKKLKICQKTKKRVKIDFFVGKNDPMARTFRQSH